MMKSLRALLTVAFRFLRGHRGGATGFTTAAVVMMLLGGGALISDHVWLVGKRDLLLSAAGAASVATTQRLATLPGSMTDAEVHAELLPVAERYARINVLANVGKELEPDDVTVVLAVDRGAGTVDVRVSADIDDTLLSKWLYDYGGPGDMEARAGAEQASSPAEVVLTIDTTTSMNQSYGVSGSRLRAVEAAATDLVEILQPSEASSVAVAIVPWTTMVRLDRQTRRRWQTRGWAAFPDRRRYHSPHGGNNPTPVVQDIPRNLHGTWRGCLAAAIRIVSIDRPRSLATFVASNRGTMHYAPIPGLVIFPLRHFPREKQMERHPFDAFIGTLGRHPVRHGAHPRHDAGEMFSRLGMADLREPRAKPAKAAALLRRRINGSGPR